ncbi:MAG: hypothetical protein K2K57_11100 [Oscillospiraceae bacterium]|nr:hypothetical protein [Oscillospiraceae bacterium]
MNIDYTEINNTAVFLIKTGLSPEEFLKEKGLSPNVFTDTIINFLKESKEKTDSETLDSLVYLIFYFDLKSDEILDILNELLIETWHCKHEDIVTLIDEYRSEKSVEYLKKAGNMKLDYLPDESFALVSKCIHALGNIGNECAIEGLIQLSNHSDSILSFKAQKQLKRLNIIL